MTINKLHTVLFITAPTTAVVVGYKGSSQHVSDCDESRTRPDRAITVGFFRDM